MLSWPFAISEFTITFFTQELAIDPQCT